MMKIMMSLPKQHPLRPNKPGNMTYHHQVSSDEILQDFSSAAGSYFANTRIPASIVTGSSLGALFALAQFSTSEQRAPVELLLIKLYRLFSWASFILSLNASIICTMASTKVLHQQFDPLAVNSYMLLKREFEFEFVSVKWSMVTALLLFIVIVTVRMLLEFQLLTNPARKDTARFVCFSSMGLGCHLLSYINESLHNYGNFLDLTIDMIKITFRQAVSEPTVMRTCSIFGFVAACVFGCKSVLTNQQESAADLHKKRD